MDAMANRMATMRGCCCCDCAVDGPTADFSFEQTGDSPCAFQFFDESVAGECGSIVSRLWDFGDGATSTSANPTHNYAGSYPSGPWDVTLTVTDASGCTDAVIMEVDCGDLTTFTCGGHTFTLPQFMSVTFPAVSNHTCTSCTGRGGTRLLKLTNPSPSTVACGYRAGNCCTFGYTLCEDGVNYPNSSGVCPDFGATGWNAFFYVPTDGTSAMRVGADILIPSCGSSMRWADNAVAPWRTNFTGFSATVPWEGFPSGGANLCNSGAGTTVTITAV